jgi:hypothetical protein
MEDGVRDAQLARQAFAEVCERFIHVSLARCQARGSVLDVSDCSEAVVLDFEDVVGVVEDLALQG